MYGKLILPINPVIVVLASSADRSKSSPKATTFLSGNISSRNFTKMT